MNEQDVFDASLRVYNDARENLDLLYIDHQEMTELAEASRQYAERTELAYARTVAALGQGGTITPQPTESTELTGQTGVFVLSATTPVKYGNKSSNQFYQRTLPPGTYTCGDELFGDPANGLNKSCFLVGTDASSPPPSPVTTLPGEPTTPTLADFYLLHLNEGPAGSRPPQFVNSIGNGPTFNNWGQAKTTGGRFREDAAMPFGMGLDASGADNNPMAISSTAPVTLSGAWSVQGFTDKIDPDRDLWQISTNGTDDGACRIRVVGMDTGGGGRGLRAYVKVGSIDVEAFASDTIAPITVAGITGWHWILQHEVNDTYTLRSNGNLLETSDPIPGDAVGYVDPFGSYNRIEDSANGFFQAKVSELRGTRGAVYSGQTYTVPATRFLNEGNVTPGPTPSPAVAMFLLGGASQETDAFGGSTNSATTEIVAAQQRLAAATGQTIPIRSFALSGSNVQHFVNTQWPAMKAAYGNRFATEKFVVGVFSGGNDVTPNVPITLPNQHLINQKAALETVFAEMDSLGVIHFMIDLSFRDYASPTYQRDRTKGSWAWVTGVSRPLNANSLYKHSDGAAWGDLYSFWRNNRQWLTSDGIHHVDDGKVAHRNFIVDNALAPIVTGVAPTQIFPRDETYALAYSMGAVTADGTTLNVQTTATHQGTAHVAIYTAGSTPTAAQVVAGTGTGFVKKNAVVRDGQSIDKATTVAVTGLSGQTNYAVKSVFVSDALQTSAVVTGAGTTGAGAALMKDVVLQFGAQPRANINRVYEGASLSTANLVNVDGAASGIGFDITQVGFDPSNFRNTEGNAALAMSPFLIAGEMSQVLFASNSNVTRMALKNLTPGRTYRLTIGASRNAAADVSRLTQVSIVKGALTDGGATARSFNAGNPASGTEANRVVFELTSDNTGVIEFGITRDPTNGSGFYYFGGLGLQQVN